MFHESLASLSIRPTDLIALGLPRSTAYDWCSGASTPDHSAFVLALLHRTKPKQGNKSLMPSAGKRTGRKRSQ